MSVSASQIPFQLATAAWLSIIYPAVCTGIVTHVFRHRSRHQDRLNTKKERTNQKWEQSHGSPVLTKRSGYYPSVNCVNMTWIGPLGWAGGIGMVMSDRDIGHSRIKNMTQLILIAI